MKKIEYVLTFLVALSLVLSACTTPTATTTPPTSAPAQAPTAPPSPTQPPVSTQPPAETAPAAPAPTTPPSAGGPTIKGHLTFVMVQHALCAWDSFWCTVEQGIKDAAKQMDVSVTILGPDKFDLEKTASLIDQATASKPDGIGLTVTDATLFKEPINKALAAGIPVVGYNAGNGPDKDKIAYLTYIGMDEYQGGLQSGQRLIAAGAKTGVCVNHQVGHAGLDARCKGFQQAFTDAKLKAEVLGVKGEDAAQSQTTISDYYTAHPDVDGWLTLGPSGATPFYAFVDAQKPKGIFHGTFDTSPEIEKRINDGTTLFAVDQQPYAQGYMAVMYLMLVNRYGIRPALPVTPTGPGFIDKAILAKQKVAADKPLKFAMVQHALCAYDPYWCVVQKGMEQAGKDMGIDITIMGPDKFDIDKTAALIDQAVATRPDGLGATITDPVLFKPPLDKAINAGIPVVAYDTGQGPSVDKINYLTFWGAEDYVQGLYGGRRLAEAGAKKGVCINHQVGHSGLDARCQGFLDAFKEKNLPAEVLGVKGEDAAQTQTTISDYYTA
ncbi:MAG TPA: substrate-binding domain-containing protein, partial [Anaerolineaceae bacterium]|nr:substrate-binding domain-containing protein [Anaerolineaceae bacterium]